MAKSTGLGDNLYVGGFNLSGDIGSLGTINGGNSPLEVTGIDKFAVERLGGLRDGALEFTAFFNPSVGRAHDVLSTLPTTDVMVSYFRGTTLGNKAASLIAKQIDYGGERGDDGSLTFSVDAQANSFGLEWGEQLTSGVDTLTGAGAIAGVDYGDDVGGVGDDTTNFGLSVYMHVFAFTGTSATVAVQDSNDNAGADPYANVVAFSPVSAVGGYRVVSGDTAAVKRWLRVNVTGTFSNLEFAVMVHRRMTAVTF